MSSDTKYSRNIQGSCLNFKVVLPQGAGFLLLYTLYFTVLRNNPAAHQDHYGRRRIRTRDAAAPAVWRATWQHCVQPVVVLHAVLILDESGQQQANH